MLRDPPQDEVAQPGLAGRADQQVHIRYARGAEGFHTGVTEDTRRLRRRTRFTRRTKLVGGLVVRKDVAFVVRVQNGHRETRDVIQRGAPYDPIAFPLSVHIERTNRRSVRFKDLFLGTLTVLFVAEN